MPFLDSDLISTQCKDQLVILGIVSQASCLVEITQYSRCSLKYAAQTNQDERAYLNSTKVPLFTGHSISLIYLKQKFTSFLYFSSPNHPMKVVLANRSPSGKQ